MALLEIITYPDAELKKIAKPIDEITDQIVELAHNMAQTMYGAPGVGLAGPQVGKSLRIIVLDLQSEEDGSKLFTLLNPEIIEKEGEVTWEEGCLSLPDVREDIARFRRIKLRALDLEGKEITMEAEDLLAVVLQHEIDHLDGILFIDHLSRLKQALLKKKLKKEAAEKS